MRKAQWVLSKLLTSAAPHVLNKANWCSWQKAVPFVGLFQAIHQLLVLVVGHVLGCSLFPDLGTSASAYPTRAQNGGEQLPQVDGLHASQDHSEEAVAVAGVDVGAAEAHEAWAPVQGFADGAEPSYPDATLEGMKAYRQALNEQTRKAKALLEAEWLMDKLFIFQQCLEPQAHLMQRLIRTTAHSWEMEELFEAGFNRPPLLQLADVGGAPWQHDPELPRGLHGVAF